MNIEREILRCDGCGAQLFWSPKRRRRGLRPVYCCPACSRKERCECASHGVESRQQWTEIKGSATSHNHGEGPQTG